MKWITPGGEAYDESRALFNAMIDSRPAVIAACSDANDVAEALAWASAHGLAVAVRSGGHSVAGMSTIDDGLVIDVRPMKRALVDPEARTATVGAGLIWGEFDRATQQHGLATTGGRVSTTGVSGLTLGGGSGWLERSFGLACDSLLAVDLVTAGGERVHASAEENPDLFWALHGGGGNFGVVTSLTFALHELGPLVVAGLMIWPESEGQAVTRAFRDFAADAPDALGSALICLTAPPEEFVPEHLQGKPVVAVGLVYAGPVEAGIEAIRPLRELQPTVDLVDAMGYADFQCMIDDPPGLYNYWTADYHDAFPDAAVDAFLESGHSRRSDNSQQLLVPWGGAIARVADGATPLANRSARWVSHPFAMWEGPDGTEENIAWAREFRRTIAPHTNGGVYLNFIGNEGQDRIRAAFGEENYARLARIKGEFDPGNVFQGNQNILPAL